MWYEIKKYCNVIPDYALAFKFAKIKTEWPLIFPRYKDDVLQEIALCCLEANTIKELNRLLCNRIRYFYNHVIKCIHEPKKNNGKKYKKYKPNYFNHCDICGVDKKQYMYKSFIPGKIVCSACERSLKKEDAKQNI
jgi:hypothetical protein